MRQETAGRQMREPRAMCDRHASRRPWRLISSGLLSPILMVLIVGVLLTGCRSQKASADRAIEFAKIPPAAQGGRERVDTISGRSPWSTNRHLRQEWTMVGTAVAGVLDSVLEHRDPFGFRVRCSFG